MEEIGDILPTATPVDLEMVAARTAPCGPGLRDHVKGGAVVCMLTRMAAGRV